MATDVSDCASAFQATRVAIASGLQTTGARLVYRPALIWCSASIRYSSATRRSASLISDVGF
jgi:hypothetical protein